MDTPTSLIAEIETALKIKSQERRIETLRRVSDLFFAHSTRLTDDQVQLFDDVLERMVDQIESRVLAELSGRMAPLANAPANLVRNLARHEDIGVAEPVLRHSPRLSVDDLIDVAETRGQAHLMAISSRSHLHEPVTDVLLRRGEPPVLWRLADNSGARFSDGGFRTLVEMSQTDETLAEKVGTRPDLPPNRLQQLLDAATEEVRRRLLKSAAPERVREIERVLANVAKQMGEPPRDYTKARNLIAELQANGLLDKATIAEFAKSGRYEETVASIAAVCAAPLELVARIFEGGRSDAVLIACKAAGLGWVSVRTILQKRPGRQMGSDYDIVHAAEEYKRLTESTAQRVLRFWQVRQTVKGRDDAADPLVPQMN